MPDTQAPTLSNDLLSRLELLASADLEQGIKKKFLCDAQRAKKFSFSFNNVHIDFSKSHISDELVQAYLMLAEQRLLNQARYELFSGKEINATEGRAVLHTLLRDVDNQGITTKDPEYLSQARDSEAQFLTQYNLIQTMLDERATPVRDIIHVGIGGSFLGTQLLFEALVGLGSAIKLHFISNIDAHQLVSVLDQCDVESTLVIGVSKTFTTAETLQNLDSISQWFVGNGHQSFMQSFYAVTANPENAVNYGVSSGNVVTFPEWVGGRYSVWSSVSLSAALVLGMDQFQQFLAGASQVDQYFYTTELEQNVCFLAAMMDHYYANFLAVRSRAIFAYDHRLRSLVDYLQQLETESNGKDKQKNGFDVDQETSQVIWGGVGTDVQHSVFQMLHQGTSLIPCEFILVKKPDHSYHEHHKELLANGIAQTAALLAGQDIDQVRALHAEQGLSELALKAKVFSGNRPSTTLIVDRLSAKALGSLLAFYEHRTFCGGVFANINSFDQMGVELGKRLATKVKPLLDKSDNPRAQKSAEGFDPSTLNLIQKVLS
jgi:glucose-6-phosphate isomerase